MAFELYNFSFKAMGSPCEFSLYAENAALADAARAAALAEVARLEEKYSRYRPGNYLDDINRAAAAGGEAAVDAETTALLDYADTCYQQSDGLFDITSGVLRKAWRFAPGAIPPSQRQIDELLPAVGWHWLERGNGVIRFRHRGMEIDLGGIVKEYAADRAAAICAAKVIRYGLIDMGGDLHAIGPHPDGKPWLIAIRHPRQLGATLATFPLRRGALANSGDYERCIEIAGERYSHILSPKTGWPVRGLAAVSVAAPHCVLAGSASTIAMLKEEEGTAWLEELGLEYVAMDGYGELFSSSGLA